MFCLWRPHYPGRGWFERQGTMRPQISICVVAYLQQDLGGISVGSARWPNLRQIDCAVNLEQSCGHGVFLAVWRRIPVGTRKTGWRPSAPWLFSDCRRGPEYRAAIVDVGLAVELVGRYTAAAQILPSCERRSTASEAPESSIAARTGCQNVRRFTLSTYVSSPNARMWLCGASVLHSQVHHFAIEQLNVQAFQT